ncbi:MAG: argininosuccinate synthase [Acidobacteria bacterium]|nr:argininosuccinate synthase [Acidobacteriota bacterium]MSO61253.1 argininosuccinate synthase [Acidobacteriota bacterium]
MKKPIVIAYSGGLQSSVAIPWLADRHDTEVVAVTLDLGQSADLAEIRDRAVAAGAVRAHVIDAREEFVRDFVWPTLRAGALADGGYPMATAMSRPLIAKKLAEIAHIEGATLVAHGSKGRDRARIEQPLRALDGSLAMASGDGMTPAQVSEYADRLGISVPAAGADRIDDNLWGRTVGRSTDDASQEAPDTAFKLSRSLAQTPASPAVVELSFERGAPTGINGVAMTPAELVDSLSTIAGEHGVGRFDRVKTRLDGSRWRVLYEAPAAAVLHGARRDLERLSASESLIRFSHAVAAAYAGVLGRGEWFSPLRQGLDAFVTSAQEGVTGTVRVRLFKGDSRMVGRSGNPVAPHA